MSYIREVRNGGVDFAGRCLSCGRYAESSAGCTPCWQRQMSEAATSVITMPEEPVFTYPTFQVRIPVFTSLLKS